MKWAVVICLSTLSLAWGELVFVAPDEAQPLLKREQLPLDVPGMIALAEELSVLAEQETEKETAVILQRRVRQLTLAQRLHPAYPRSRRLLEGLADGSFRPIKKPDRAKRARGRLNQAASWLRDHPEGSEAQRLALLLKDVTGKSAQSADDSLWAGVVAPASAFRKKKAPLPKPEPIQPPKPRSREKNTYQRYQAQTRFPIIAAVEVANLPNGNTPPRFTHERLSLSLIPDQQGIEFFPKVRRLPPARIHQLVKDLFRNIGQPLPGNHRMSLMIEDHRYHQANQENIAGPLAMLLDSCVSGKDLIDHVVFLAVPDSDGSLRLPDEPWTLLRTLEEAQLPPGIRVIVPPSAEELLRGFLTLERFEFLLHHDFLAAETFNDARSLFYQDSELPLALAQALQPFEEVREKAPSSGLTGYFNHKGVRTRIAQAAQEPTHLSARILHIQAQGKRPTWLTKANLAHELLHITAPVSVFEIAHYDERRAKDLFTALRDQLNAIELKAQIDDRPLLNQTELVLKKIPPLARVMGEKFQQIETQRLYGELQASVTELRERLRALTGE